MTFSRALTRLHLRNLWGTLQSKQRIFEIKLLALSICCRIVRPNTGFHPRIKSEGMLFGTML
jgi:hypothetical protein